MWFLVGSSGVTPLGSDTSHCRRFISMQPLPTSEHSQTTVACIDRHTGLTQSLQMSSLLLRIEHWFGCLCIEDKMAVKLHNGELCNMPVTSPCPEPHTPSQQLPTQFTKITSSVNIPSTPRSSEWSLAFRFSDESFVRISHLSLACYMLHSSHSP
jgi:hypothetical protein